MKPRLVRFWQMVREEGPARAIGLAWHRAAATRWERRLGIETAGDHLLAQEGLARPAYHDHSPSSVLDLRRALRIASPSPESDTFIDFGSGRGRVVLMAAMLPFRRVIGVEISPQLNEVARRNLEIARSRLSCQEVELVTASADQYEVPHDVTVVYFYNPFSGDVLNRVVANVRRSLEAAPRRLTVVYGTPPHFERAVAGRDWAKLKAEFMGLRRYAIYEFVRGA